MQQWLQNSPIQKYKNMWNKTKILNFRKLQRNRCEALLSWGWGQPQGGFALPRVALAEYVQCPQIIILNFWCLMYPTKKNMIFSCNYIFMKELAALRRMHIEWIHQDLWLLASGLIWILGLGAIVMVTCNGAHFRVTYITYCNGSHFCVTPFQIILNLITKVFPIPLHFLFTDHN